MHTEKQIQKNRCGYTIVEVLISAMIVMVAIAAVVVIISRGSKINMDDLLRRRAYQVMEAVLEGPDMSYKNYGNLLTLIGTAQTTITQNLPNADLHKVGNELITGTVKRRLTRKLLTHTSGIKIPCIEVVVTVNYQNKTESLSTIITSTAP
jgi:Tfp pilus assembly protein PilV